MMASVKIGILVVCLCVGVKCMDFNNRFSKYMKVVDSLETNTKFTLNFTSPVNFTTKCFGDFGCFSNGPPFYDPVHRPVTVLPSDDPHSKINYWLYTPHNPLDKYVLRRTKESLDNSPFNPSVKTVIYLHGWQRIIYPTDLMYQMKDALLKQRGYNFVIIDWMEYSSKSTEEAIANARVVGAATAKLIQFLTNNTDATAADFHIIGYSLGGQIAGYAGKGTPGLGRITGLDSVGFYFYANNSEVRLNPGDALFVDAIHTNGGENGVDGLGMLPPIGHQDFYVNGGRQQPDCGHDDPEMEERIKTDYKMLYLVNCCDHMRSKLLFLESILNPNCTFKGRECDSYEDWKRGECQSPAYHTAVMGIDAKPIPGLPPRTKFYLDTKLKAPFCRNSGYETPTKKQVIKKTENDLLENALME